MAVYFVIGAVIVAWALILSFGGMARVKDFPNKRAGRLLMLVSGGLCLAGFVALMATTEREHPREEAKAEAAEQAEARERLAPGGTAQGQEAGEKQAEGGTIPVTEDEYSIKLPVKTLEAGPYAVDVVNKGKVEHDLQVEGGSVGDGEDRADQTRGQRNARGSAAEWNLQADLHGARPRGARDEDPGDGSLMSEISA